MSANKFDSHIFASTANSSELKDFPDVNRGWGVSTDNTPSMEFLNGAFNWVDKNIHFIIENSIVEFQADLTYYVGNLVKYKGSIWRCIKETIIDSPHDNSEFWVQYMSGDYSGDILALKNTVESNNKSITEALNNHKKSTDHPDASTSSKGFVKLNNSNNSTSTSEAATTNAAKVAYDRGTEALNKANSLVTFQQSSSQTGWVKLPNGIILQWGRVSGVPSFDSAISDKGKVVTITATKTI